MTTTDTATRIVRLTVGRLTVGLDLERLFGIDRADRMRPGTEPGAIGTVLNKAGAWPVFALADRLGVTTEADRKTGQVVLLELDGVKVGLLVDRVSSGFRADAADIRPMPAAAGRSGPYSRVLVHADGPVLLIDPERLFVDDSEAEDDRPPPTVNVHTGRAADRIVLFGQVVCPSLGGRAVEFGVPAGSVAEIADPPVGSSVPSSQSYVREVVTWRGRPITVIDPAVWCGLEAPVPASRRVVVVRTPGREPVGLAAGGGVRVLPLPLPHLATRRVLQLHPGRVKGIFDLTAVTVVLPNLSALTREA